MLQIRRICVLGAAAVAGLAFSSGLRAAVIAADSVSTASPGPYTAGTGDNTTTEFNGLNGGFGFGPWVVTDVETPPATGATNTSPSGNGGAFINTATNDTARLPGPNFDVFDNGNAGSSSPTGALLGSSIETASRSFLQAMGAGGSFSFNESLTALRGANAGSPTSQVGFELLDSSGNVLLNLFCNGGGAGYLVTDLNQTNFQLVSTDPAHSAPNPTRALTINTGTNPADVITITINDAAGDFTIVSSGHEGSTFADGGQIDMSTGGPAAFAIYDNNGGNGSDIRVNSLSETAVPEPVSGALVGLGLVALLRRRR